MSSTHLKRTWSLTNAGTQGSYVEQPIESSSRSGVPPLPKINGETLLQVLTHRSLRRPGDVSADFDNERLSELGARGLEAAITVALFHRRPILSGSEMLAYRKSILSEENLDGWVSMYCLREKVRCSKEVASSLNSPEETRILFNAYVGGLYKEQGLEAVQSWLDGLTHDSTPVKPSVTTQLSSPSSISINTNTTSAGPPPYLNVPPPNKKAKADPPMLPASQSPSSHYLPPNMFPKPQTQYAAPKPFSNPLSPAQPHLAFLPLFNQTAAQRRVTVDYPANCSGPPHAPRWGVQCKVNGILKGTGAGNTKQEAKELAAREAWFNLGWS
ncbi:hypothetical protein EV361DRAFT_924441 [Lentinula raphanica]|uniref:Uncharacterized protein n=1 Tax=Lentinula raphanica TaxID=153919 RepID=A0AA38UF07_9AGAR|nr:hypothetical protein FB446DRAFT_740570 [Lentinula raphanica]KAJ3819433.1 hypothetical protein F5880DRAFT_1616471 [Lentinula raphanica]KAJ3838846.1 hypothetical protein F5878DRAFT_618397 [Lentinula raphanica]KAJ3968760.1 hypothetical protein EV361DRAFT_924441 [Lentinula raphanica]